MPGRKRTIKQTENGRVAICFATRPEFMDWLHPVDVGRGFTPAAYVLFIDASGGCLSCSGKKDTKEPAWEGFECLAPARQATSPRPLQARFYRSRLQGFGFICNLSNYCVIASTAGAWQSVIPIENRYSANRILFCKISGYGRSVWDSSKWRTSVPGHPR